LIELSLAGKGIVVTGASRGIGRAVATQIAAAGANVLAVSRSGGSPEGEKIIALAIDIREDDAPDRIVETALRELGSVDGLVNNAGIIYWAKCWEHSDEEWDDLFATNLTAPFRLSQRVVSHWLDRGDHGVIVNMCSAESEVVFPDQCGYAATKGGLLALTRAMALELAPQGIRVTAIGPGVIDTGLTGPFKEETERRIPLGRLGLPEDIGDTAVFLLSERARYVTGAIFYVDGGYLLQ
jgi:NAD(P)-dependent dehydrogenase (short-subunit alcohol dehydrogenase family)